MGTHVTKKDSSIGRKIKNSVALISEVDEKHVSYRDVPIFVFTGKFDPRFTSKDELMRPTTKEDFEQAVQRTVENINADYPESVEPKEYLDVVTEWGKMLQEALFDDMFVTIDEFPAE